MAALSHHVLSLPTGETRLIGAGEGRGSILFFPAIGDSAINYVPTLEEMARRGFRSMAVDPPGYGMQEGEAPPTFDDLMGQWCEELCKTIDGPKILIGNSVGAAVATGGVRAPDVCGLALVGWPVFVEALPTPTQLMPRTAAELDRLLRNSWFKPPPLGPSALRLLLARMDNKVQRAHANSLDPVTWLECLFDYEGPLLFVAGKNDGLVPLEAMYESSAEIPRSEIVVIDECGHYPHREQVGRFCDTIVQFAESSLPSA